MTTIEQVESSTGQEDEIAVTIVDTDVHPLPVSADVLKSYAPAEWVDKIWPTGNAVTPVPHFYDTPDSYKTMSLRLDAAPPNGGFAGSDPDFAAKQLLLDAGVSIATLEPMCDAQLPQAEHVLKSTYNDWLADVWLDKYNWHGRWRGSISVSAQTPEQAAREVERWAGHPYMAQVLMTPQTRGIPFGNPHFDPLYEAASRNGFPVATHLMGQTPFELIPLYPVGNPAHWHDFFASWPLLYVSHLMSLVFDGAFDRHPDLRVVFVEGGFTWAMPVMSRMDRIWEARRGDLPHVRRRPSDYVREHVRFTTQPLEDFDTVEFREYLEMMDLGDNLSCSQRTTRTGATTPRPTRSTGSPPTSVSGSCAVTRPRCTGYPRPSRPFPENGEAVAGLAAKLRALISEYDAKWSALDVAGIADLWEGDSPRPTYIGDEYAMPLIGADELDRHWARLAGRLKRASVSSQLWSADALGGGLARCVLLSRWSFTGEESDIAHTGASWITWLLTPRGDKYRIFHHMESQVYLEEGFDMAPWRARRMSAEVERV